MEAWVGVFFGALAGQAAARIHPWSDGGWLLSLPAGALGGLIGAQLWADSFAAMLEHSQLAGIAVAAFIGGIVGGASSGPIRHYGVTSAAATLRRASSRNTGGPQSQG